MQIFYTNKTIFWANEGNDFVEKSVFENYLNDWTQISNTKSINWEDHYSANFYATDSFQATYFKVIKNNYTYYFFIQDIEFDSANGRKYYLTLDFYYTYAIHFIETLKARNPAVVFKRKHADRFLKNGNNKYIDIANKNNYLNNIPDYLNAYSQYVIPISKTDYTKKNYTVQMDRITVPQSVGTLTIDDNDYSEYYLQIKRPNKAVSSTASTAFANGKQIFYVPLSFGQHQGPNSYYLLSKIPADYVVGLIKTHIRPSQFTNCDYAKELYKFSQGDTNYGNEFFDSESIILVDRTNDYKDTEVNVSFFPNINETYNINNYVNEPMLYLSPFTYFKICDNSMFYANYYLKENQYLNSFNKITIKSLVDTQILVVPPIENSLYVNEYWSTLFFENTAKIPFSGNVYESYLLNNVNSINTGIALAKEQRDMTVNQGNIKGGLQIATGILSGGLGLLTGNTKMAFGGMDSIIGGSTDVAFNKEKAEFNYKSTVAKVDAQKADVANKPNTMLDTYGDGMCRTLLSVLSISKYALPINYQKMVFSDFYFNGYIVNTVMPFNEYDNRKYFNYFEISNVYNLATQYLKYPKRILKDLARFIEQGIRIWKTDNFDYTMVLDNRETKYA